MYFHWEKIDPTLKCDKFLLTAFITVLVGTKVLIDFTSSRGSIKRQTNKDVRAQNKYKKINEKMPSTELPIGLDRGRIAHNRLSQSGENKSGFVAFCSSSRKNKL